MTHTIARADLRDFLSALGARYFGVTYLTRTPDKATGERVVKRMTCTNAYDKFTVGGQSAYDAEAKGLYTVADTKALQIGYAKLRNGEVAKVSPIRSFGLEGVSQVRANGITYTVTD